MSSNVLGTPGVPEDVQRVLHCVARGQGHAAVLGLSRDDCTNEIAISSAARKLWLRVHPDKTHNCTGSHQAFLAVKAAEKALREKVALLPKGPAAAAAAAAPSQAPRTPEPKAKRAAPQPRARAWRSPERQDEEEDEEDGSCGYDDCGYDHYEECDNFDSWGSSSRWGATWSFYEARRTFEKKLVAAARAAAAKKEAKYQEELLRGATPWAARALLATAASVPSDGTRINQTFAMREYGLSTKGLQGLKPELLQNRHNPTYAPEKMFKHQKLEKLAEAKFKSPNWRQVLQARRDKREANKAKRQAARTDAEGNEGAVVLTTPVRRQPKSKSGPKTKRSREEASC